MSLLWLAASLYPDFALLCSYLGARRQQANTQKAFLRAGLAKCWRIKPFPQPAYPWTFWRHIGVGIFYILDA